MQFSARAALSGSPLWLFTLKELLLIVKVSEVLCFSDAVCCNVIVLVVSALYRRNIPHFYANEFCEFLSGSILLPFIKNSF